jgi:hypothetical protein
MDSVGDKAAGAESIVVDRAHFEGAETYGKD